MEKVTWHMTVAVMMADFLADTTIVVGITIAVGSVALMLREAWKIGHRD